MDPDHRKPPVKLRYVGKAPQKGFQYYLDSAWRLAGSVHPYAPFTGNSLNWNSYVYDDGSTYEGLMRLNIPHNAGVLNFGTYGGAGIPHTQLGDRYEGDFETGWAHGMGQFTGANGKIFRGEYITGQRHGCGMEEDISSYIKRLDAGEDSESAWAAAQPAIRKSRRYGTWVKNKYRSGPDAAGIDYCSMPEIMGTLQEVQHVVNKARMFEFKPDGEVTLRMMQDANGLPLALQQDPLHYPHGTGFLMPGPAGQCFAMPESRPLREAMARALHNARLTWDRHNLDYDFVPGTPLARGFAAFKKQRFKARLLQLEDKLRKGKPITNQERSWARGLTGLELAGGSPPPPTAETASKTATALADGMARAAGDRRSRRGSAKARRAGRADQTGFESTGRGPLASLTLGLQSAAQGLGMALGDVLAAVPRRGLTRPQRPRTE